MRIIISPFSRGLIDGKPHPKNYPIESWKQVIKTLKLNHEIIQVGVTGEEILTHDFRFDLPIPKLVELLKEVDLFISVDNFMQHMAHHYGRRGIVIFSQSDPRLFGYPENTNLLKDKKYLRQNQFWLWEQAEFIEESFVDPSEVIKAVENFTIQAQPLRQTEFIA